MRKNRMARLSVVAAVLLVAACGDTVGERAATGALGGAVIAGPPGAIVGGTVGAVTD